MSKKRQLYIYELSYRGRNVRLLLSRGAIESASYTDPELRDEIVSPYLRQLSWAFSFRPGITKTLMLGGGGFVYPRYYLKTFPEKRIDVVEVSRGMIRISREFFFLDDFLREQKMSPASVFGRNKTDSRFRVFREDGFNYLLRADERYDFIIEDAYAGKKAVSTLRSEDGVRLMKARLTRGGICAVNVVSARKGPLARKGREMEAVLKRHFRCVAVIPCDEEESQYKIQNLLMFASDEVL